MESFAEPASAADAKRAFGLPGVQFGCALAGSFVIAHEVGSLAHVPSVGTGGSTVGFSVGSGRVWSG